LPDDFTLGEVQRGLQAHRQESAEQHRVLDERITNLASRTVTEAVYQLDKAATVEMARRLERDRVDDVQRLEREHARDMAIVAEQIKELRAKPWLTTGRIIVIAMAVIALATLLVTAWGTWKGAK
jgi:hypothetical protein